MGKKYACLDFPAWFDGKDVNGAVFCREFLSKDKRIYADSAFFTPEGWLTGPLLKEKIYAEPKSCAAENIPRRQMNFAGILALALKIFIREYTPLFRRSSSTVQSWIVCSFTICPAHLRNCTARRLLTLNPTAMIISRV